MDNVKKKRILSGIQPSGHLMIGNYLGALKNWVQLQDQYECYYVLVDMHAITVRQDPKELRKRSYDLIALYIAAGIDPKKSVIFIQSHVPQHAELSWVLNCITYTGELNRMTQFKDKSKKYSKNINAGLYTYPVLMAADILLYQADLVPVGHDQKQHLELTRDLAQRFNSLYSDTFTVPEPYIPKVGARIMSLQEPLNKMSKSDENPNNYIALLDEPGVIRNKIKRAVTDSEKTIRYDQNRPGISNLMTIYSVISGKSFADIEQEYSNRGYEEFKSDLGNMVADYLSPLQKRFHEIRGDRGYMDDILKEGAQKAYAEARKTLSKVYRKTGFVQIK